MKTGLNVNAILCVLLLIGVSSLAFGTGIAVKTDQTSIPTIYNPTENLTPFDSDRWVTDNPWGLRIDQLNVFHDVMTTYNSQYTIRIDPLPSTPNTAFDFSKIDVSPGHEVYFECWIKTSGTDPQDWSGARINLDFYGSK